MGERVKRIFRNLNDGVDLIVFLNSVDPHIDMSFFYATGVTDGLFEGCAAWLTPDGRAAITTSALEEEAAKKSGLPLDVFRSREESTKLLKKRLAGARKIGVNASDLTYAAFQPLRKLAPRAAQFVDISEAVMKARLVKDAQEVDRIQRACDIASRASEETVPFIQTGVTEAEVASELVYRMQKNGATAPSFRTIVGSGPNGAEPHYTAGPRKIERGDMIVIDFGAQYHMYCSDITRTVVIGPPPAEQRRMHDTVARAQAAALAKMKPGARGKAADAAARSLIDRTKYKGRFIHGLGHSVGLPVHDPSGGARPPSDLVLPPNMGLPDEARRYIPGFGGGGVQRAAPAPQKGARGARPGARG